MQRGLVKRVLVICPLSIMKSAWQQDLFKFAIHRTVSVAHGSAKKRKEIINAGSEFVVINFDGVGIVKNELLKGGFDLIVVDEASAYKNAQTVRWKDLRDLTKVIRGLWMLTGTPAAQAPTDAYGLAKLVNPKGIPQFFTHFKDMVMTKVSQYRYIPKPTAKHIVHTALQPAIRFEKRQCIDLPPLTFVERDAPLTPQQSGFYKLLKKEMMIEAAGEEISAVNAATQINKLLQISCGSIYTDTGEVVDFDVSNRLNVVQEIVDECSNKVLIFVPFTHSIALLEKHLTKNGVACEIINGSVSVNKRADVVKQFQEQPEPRVLVIQPQAASHGVTLHAANTVVWWAPITSYETYAQANARVHRAGQVNKCLVVKLQGSPVEKKLYKALDSKEEAQMDLMELYKDSLKDIQGGT
jgi:SNF2 family DNA or RNA helicase